MAHIIPKFIKKRVSNLSNPNQHVLAVLQTNLLNLCKEDIEAMEQINAAFGFHGLTVDIPRELKEPTRPKRQLAIITTMVVNSLLTYFSTKTLVSMA